MAAVAAASDEGDREETVIFLSNTVAGSSGLEGKGHVSKLRVTCRREATSGCGALLLRPGAVLRGRRLTLVASRIQLTPDDVRAAWNS